MPRPASGVRKDFDLTPEVRMDARRALAILDGSGLSLERAATLARLHPTAEGAASATLAEACDGYLRRLLRLKKRGATFRWYESRFRRLLAAWPEKHLDEVSRADAAAFLAELPVGETTRNGYRRAMHALWAWALSQEPPLCRTNPVEGIRVEGHGAPKSPEILHAREARAVLDGAGVYRHAVALMLFAGIRPEEIAGQDKPPMVWRSIDRRAKTIRIEAACAKTGHPRVIENHGRFRLPAALWTWLTDGPMQPDAPICPARIQQAREAAQRALRKLQPPGQWSSDVLRHTAASYLLALWGDAGRVSMVLGHEGKTHLLYQRYRALMTRAEAEALAGLRPGGN